MAIISSIAMWFSRNDGKVQINWLGWEIYTSVSFFFIAIFSLFFILTFLIVLFIKLLLFPSRVRKKLRISSVKKAKDALYNGIIASSYGDKNLIRKNYNIAKKTLKESPLLLFLKLKDLDFNYNEGESFKTLTSMLNNEITRPLAVKKIIKLAMNNNDNELFYNMLHKSREHKISMPFIIYECLDFCIHNNDWLYFSNYLKKYNLKKNNQIKRIESLINYHIGKNFFINGEKSKAKEYIIKALENNKNFPPIVELYCKLKIAKSERKLINILRKYWSEFPHPNIEMCLENGLDSKNLQSNLTAMHNILKKSRESYIKYLVYGKMKYKAKIWGEAKKDILKSIEIKPSKHAYLYLAKIEKSFSHQENKAEKWIKLSNKLEDDFRWVCKSCAYSQSDWDIYCNNCKNFDSLQWKPTLKKSPEILKKNVNEISIA